MTFVSAVVGAVQCFVCVFSAMGYCCKVDLLYCACHLQLSQCAALAFDSSHIKDYRETVLLWSAEAAFLH